METPEWVVPWCTVVAGQIDLCSGGKGVLREDPDEKAKTLIDRGLPSEERKSHEKEKQTYKRD